jgi:hypothetical protein
MPGTSVDDDQRGGESIARPEVDPQSADARRARIAFIGLASAYALALLVLDLLGQFGFVWKTLVVPALLIVAYVAKRFRAFVRDWAVFLGAIVLFDCARGLIYGLVVRYERRVYMGYAIELEQNWFGTPVPSVRMQHAFGHVGQIGWLDQLLVMVHASHFLVFLFFALRLWLVRQQGFARFKLAMLLVMYTGIALYFIVPTVPPWMAAGRFYVVDPIEHIPAQVYNLATPALAQSFDVNPVAAMPSLHAAFPALLTLTCFEHFGVWGFAMLAYTLAVFFAIVYLGEHYVIDVLAGATLACLAYLVAYRVPVVTRLLARKDEPNAKPSTQGMLAALAQLKRPLLVTALLLVLAQFAGNAARAMLGRDVPTEQFIARELDGKSPMAAYYRGLNAYYARDFVHARAFFARAIGEVPDVKKQARAYLLLGESAFHAGDFRGAAQTLASQPKLTGEQALMLAEARLKLGERAVGFQVLDFVAQSAPDDAQLQARKQALERAYRRTE